MAIRSELILDGITNPITVHICNVNINQPIDASNRPNSSPRAGIIRLTISRVTLHHLREWAIDPNMRKGGEVRYITDSGNSQTSILFHDAYCIDYSERFNSVNTESLTVDLTISAHRILFGGNLRIVNSWPGIVTPASASEDVDSSHANFTQTESSSSSSASSSSASSSSSDDGPIMHPSEI